MSVYNSISNSVIFVYLGDSLPKYTIASLKLAKEYSGMNVHILSSKKNRKLIDPSFSNFTAIEDFYDDRIFNISKKKILNNLNFRNNFWIKTLERFFVLHQFAKANKLNSFFHAELDQLLFGVNELILSIEKTKKTGIFVPFHNNKMAIASVFYCNNIDSLNSMLTGAGNEIVYRNEMELIANWAANNHNSVISLPTMASKIIRPNVATPKNIIELSPLDLGGVVDAAQVGQWVGGIDTIHIPIHKTPKTKFVDSLSENLISRKQFEKFKFQVNFQKKKLEIVYNNTFVTRIFNLHIHSKIHQSLLDSKSSLIQLFEMANKDETISLRAARNIQLRTYAENVFSKIKNPAKFTLALRDKTQILKKKINYLIRRRPTSYPFISGDTFRKISDLIWEKQSKNINPKNVKTGDIIFCESDLVEELNRQILCKINVSVILLLGNSDFNHNRSNHIKFKHNNIFGVYAQNLLDEIPGWKVLPIGIENAWLSNNGKLSRKIIKQSRENRKIFRVMWGFNVDTNIIERLMAAKALLDCSAADKLELTTAKIYQQTLQKYSFVASPPGNGLDVHRTWEAFYFKCVPIVKRSHMTLIYESIGLPIWLIDSYEELKNVDEDELKKKYLNFVPSFNNKAIWADYWINQIQKLSDKAKNL